MTKSLIYKEWLKTGKIIVCLAILIAGFTAYDFIALAKNAELQGYEFLWNYAISKNSILVENLIYLPAICGMVLLRYMHFVDHIHHTSGSIIHISQSLSCRGHSMENSVLFAYMVLLRVMRIYLDKRDMSGTKLENETH